MCMHAQFSESLSAAQSETRNTRQKLLPHHPAPLVVTEAVIAASAAATMNTMYSLLICPNIA